MATADLGKVTGDSAYELWLAQGHTGTIDDFLSRQVWPTMSSSVAGVAKLGRGLYLDDGTLNVTGYVPYVDDDVDWADILTMCQAHQLPVGTEIVSTWHDTVNGINYDFPWIVADNRTMVDADGVTRTGSVLLAKYSPNRNVQFDAGNSSVWKTSDIRLWLNSDAAAGEWWEPQITGDTEPTWAAGMPGFMYELPDAMLAVVREVKMTSSDTTSEKFWLPSYSQYYCATGGAEGTFKWFSDICGSAGYSEPTNANIPGRIITQIQAKSTGANTWSRTAYNRSPAYYVTASGGGTNNNAYNSYRALPACFIG